MKLKAEEKRFALSLIDEAYSNGASKSKSCNVLGITIRSYQRWGEGKLEDLRKGPKEVAPKLADKGIYLASESTFYRILEENKLLVHRGRSRPTSHYRPPAVIAYGVNEVWSWDITYLKGPIRGEYFYLYMVIDIYSRMIVRLVSKLCKNHGIKKKQLILHADNGGPMKGATMLATLQKSGVVPSFSRPTVSDDNPFSEALFKTLKYCPQYPLRGEFGSLEAAQLWVENFVEWYNEKHLHSEINYGRDKMILENRKEVYEKARSEKPGRWKRGIKDWNYKSEVPLNHINKVKRIKPKPAKVMAMKIA